MFVLQCCFNFGTMAMPKSTAISASNRNSTVADLLLWQQPAGLLFLQAPALSLPLKVAFTKSLWFYL